MGKVMHISEHAPPYPIKQVLGNLTKVVHQHKWHAIALELLEAAESLSHWDRLYLNNTWDNLRLYVVFASSPCKGKKLT